jgi:cytochrome oxidase Cu insertion factor (SCO1/SenC/PrrC family)
MIAPNLILLLGALLHAGGEPSGPGPAVGQKIPPFEAVDQDGQRRDFVALRGPKGLVLLFFRSADW